MNLRASAIGMLLGLGLVVGCGDAYEEAPPPELPPPPPQSAPVDGQPMPPSMSTNTSSGPNAVTANENQNVTIEQQPSPPPAAPAQAPAATAGATVVTTEAAPSETTWVYAYPTGHWVFMSDYGWVWIPADAEEAYEDGVPYEYLYTPRWGWTWYVSPWGPGPYHYGIWVRHPWHPVGWRGGFVAHPHVVVNIHAGGHYGYHGGYHGYHGGYHGHGGGHHR